MSVVEATLENPGPVLTAQLDRLKTEALAAMKAAGVEYEERIEALDKLEYPKPMREWTYDLFDAYRLDHPWAADYNIRPKSVARDLFERAMTFSEYIAHYGLTRSEGVVLRYLSDVYRGLVRNVPEDLKTDELEDLSEWLGELVRQVDSSLIDEWERLAAASAASSSLEEAVTEIGLELSGGEPCHPPPVTSNARAFKVMTRNAAFRRVELAARRDVAALAEGELPGGLDAAGWSEALEQYFSVHATTSASDAGAAGGAEWFDITELQDRWQRAPGPRRPGGLARQCDHRRGRPRRRPTRQALPAWPTLRLEQELSESPSPEKRASRRPCCQIKNCRPCCQIKEARSEWRARSRRRAPSASRCRSRWTAGVRLPVGTLGLATHWATRSATVAVSDSCSRPASAEMNCATRSGCGCESGSPPVTGLGGASSEMTRSKMWGSNPAGTTISGRSPDGGASRAGGRGAMDLRMPGAASVPSAPTTGKSLVIARRHPWPPSASQYRHP